MQYSERYKDDIERLCFFYAIGVSSVLRDYIDDVYDFRINKIRIDALDHPWLTRNTERLLRFALNMYGSRPITAEAMVGYETKNYEEAYREACLYNISELFADSQDAPYMLEALKMRYSLK